MPRPAARPITQRYVRFTAQRPCASPLYAEPLFARPLFAGWACAVRAALGLLLLTVAGCQDYHGPVDNPRGRLLPGPLYRIDPLERGE